MYKEFQKFFQSKNNVYMDFYMKFSAEFRCNFGWKKQTTSAIKSWLEQRKFIDHSKSKRTKERLHGLLYVVS